jgi:hypothetical protein
LRPKQVKTKRQVSGASAVGQEAKVSDTQEALWKQMQQEAAQELNANLFQNYLLR